MRTNINSRKIVWTIAALDAVVLGFLAAWLVAENARGLAAWLAYAWASLWTFKGLARLSFSFVVLAALAKLGGLAWDAYAQRRKTWEIHKVRLGHMATLAAHAQVRQLPANQGRGGWTVEVEPGRAGYDIQPLDTPLDRMLAAQALARPRLGRMPHVPELKAPGVTLPTLVRPEDVLGEVVSYRDLVLGVGPDGVVHGNLVTFVHWAIGGSSGWGKSMLLRWICYQLAQSVDPVDLVLVDLEDVTLAPFEKAANTRWPVARDERTILAVFRSVMDELDRRKELFARFREQGVDSLAKYNRVAGARLAPIVLVADEVATLMENKDIKNVARPLLYRSRKYGVWNMWAAQVWYADTIDSKTGTMFSTATHFHAEKKGQGRTLGMPEAADITVQGRAIMRMPGKATIEIQTPYVRESHIRALSRGGPMFAEAPELIEPDDGPPGEDDARLAKLLDGPMAAQVSNAMADGYDNPTAICEALGKSPGGRPWLDVRLLLRYFAASTTPPDGAL